MAKGEQQSEQRRRAPVIRGKRPRRTKVRPTQATKPGRQTRPPAPSSSSSAASSSDPANFPQARLRDMRAQRRQLLQQLAETERRAKSAEKERDELRDQQNALWDKGTELWQNVWDTEDTSQVLKFPTKKSVICDSVYLSGGNSMPGVHSLGAIDKGRTTQSIWLKGTGYALVGLVTSEEEKKALRHHGGDDFTQMPLMTSIFSPHEDDREGDVFTIEIDMIERRAKLYVSDKDSSRILEPHQVWEGLPDRVWVAIAFKRNSGREAVLMPCIHCDMTEGEDNA